MILRHLEVLICEEKLCILPFKSNIFCVKACINDRRCQASLHIFPFRCHRSQRQTLHVLGNLKTLRCDELIVMIDLDQFCPTSGIWRKR